MAPRARAGARPVCFEIDLHFTLAILAFAAVPLAVHKVSTVAIHFANRRLKVVQIGLDLAVTGIFRALFAAAILPALTLVAERPGRHHVFPFDAIRPVGIFTHLIATGGEVRHAFFPFQWILQPQ